MQQWVYKELVCVEKSHGLNVEWENNKEASERFPANNRPLSTYLTILGEDGWEVVGITDGGIEEPEKSISSLRKWYFSIFGIDRREFYQPAIKKVYIILKRQKGDD